MLQNADITLFYSRKEGNQNIYRQVVIKGVHWEELQQSNVVKSGEKNSDSVMIYIPLSALEEVDGREYIQPKQYSLVENGDQYFTITANTKNLIVKGIIDWQFNCTSERDISESIKYLNSHFDNVVTINVVDSYLYGSPQMQHLEISCK